MKLSQRVARTIRRHALVGADARVLVALSGGPDSVALVHLLLELQASGDLTVVGLAHFNHQLRGVDADADEAFCRAMAKTMDLPIEVGRADVATAARAAGRSIEDLARELRYAFFGQVADRMGADAIALGHSLDDQAETFLLRLIRGAGSRGLAAILPRAGRVIRPLLGISRAELRQYAADRSLAFCNDATNADLSIPRNRVRHELIPYLEREFSPGISRVLAREAELARQDEDHLQAEAIDFAGSIVLRRTGGKTELDAAALRSLPLALAARVARHALSLQAPGHFIAYDHVDRLLQCAGGADGEAVDLPGQRAVRRGDVIALGPPLPRRRDGGPANSFRYSLSIPGEVRLDNQGWMVSAERLDSLGAGGPGPGRAAEVVVAADPLAMPLAIRSRRRGDRFCPLGFGHRK
jgi:tRNA(Ile)-lysidine synthase